MGAPLKLEEEIQSLDEILGKDLSGYQLVFGYYLKLEHWLMGFFPAVIRDDNAEREREPEVICLNKASLRKVWDRLPPRPAKIGRELLLITPDQATGFSVGAFERYIGERNKPGPIPILTDEVLDKLCEHENPFAWAPGLVQLVAKEVEVPNFDS